MPKPHPLKGRNRFKLGVFSSNADGGLAITTVPERWRASWDDNLNAVGIADRAGIEFFLPIARWRGFGGRTKVREWSFETFTWAAGLAAATQQIGLFMTVHVPLLHPVYAAKALATVDHISHGRAGLNIVCGWNPDEFAMFGVTLGNDAYGQAAEWIETIERAYGSSEPFDFDGKYYQLKGVVSRPASVQVPRPVTMNAAFGAPGRNFAAKNCDYLFSTFSTIEDGHRHVADIRERAAAFGREVGIYTVCHVVCRETQAEAEEYYHKYAVAEADHGAVDYHMASKKEFAGSHDKSAFDLYRQRFAGGAGTYPLIGTPERIVEDMIKIADSGYAGTALTFVNYSYELPFFCDRVLPLMKQAGLRVNWDSMLATVHRTAGAVTFKQGMRALVGGVTVIATQDARGAYLGLTATSVTSLSADPPSILVCVNRSSPMAEALRTGMHFSANVLSENQVDVAQAFGGQRGVRGVGRFAYGSWFRSAHDVPLLSGACVSFECIASEGMEWATHRVVIGRVCDVHFSHPATRPLVYHDGRYTTVE